MREPSEEPPDWEAQRNRIIGLGETSIRKSYFPELQQRIQELEEKNKRLQEAYAEQTAIQEELRQQYDETRRKEQELRESEAFLESIVENLPLMLFVKNASDLKFVRFNRAGEELLGYSREEMIGRSDYDFFPKENADYFTEKDRLVLRSNTPLDIPEEYIGTRFKGVRVLHTRKIPFISASGMPRFLLGLSEDITEQRKAEIALRESEQRFSRFMENLPAAVYIKDTDGNLIFSNRYLNDLLGWTPDTIGRSTRDLFPPDIARRIMEDDRAALSQGIVSLTESLPDIQGRMRSFTTTKFALPAPAGPALLAGISLDITDRLMAEQALQESERQLATLMANMPGMAYRCRYDPAWTMVFVSEGCRGLTGYDPAMLTNNASVSYAAIIHADDRQAVAEQIQAAVTENRQFTLSYRIITRDGQLKWVWEQGICTQYDDGTPRILEGFITDITTGRNAQEALRRSEERYRLLVDITETGYVVIDSRGMVVDANEVYARLTGRSSPSDVIGHPQSGWIAPHDLDRSDREMDQCRTTGRIRGLEIEYIRPDGTLQPVEINAAVIPSDTGSIILALCRDISERRRTHVALQQARSKLNLLNAVTFQDIQTAAFSLSAYHELLMNISMDGRMKAYLEKQELFLKKMVGTLAFARNYQEMGIHPPRWQNVRQVFLFAISHLDFLAITQDIRIGNLEIFADPLLEKALFNIMENVLNHGIRATEVRLQYTENPDGLLLIIEDNGVGIPVEEKHMIFDRGYGKGTGLGLFLVREVLSITGMSIRENGTPGKGTRFEIGVPRGVYRILPDEE